MIRLFNLTFFENKTKSQPKSLKVQYKKFNFLFVSATVIPLLLVSAINYLVDPYDFFNTPNFLSINHFKPKKDFNDRLFKTADIIRIKPVTVILGSSRTKQGINPEHPELKNDKSVYNLALNGPNLYEVRRYLEHAIANQKNLKQVIFGVDFFMFNKTLKNQPSFLENRLEKTYFTLPDLINALFSINTLAASQTTIQASQREQNKNTGYGENGFMPHRKVDDGRTKGRFNYSIGLFFSLHSSYEFSQEYFAEFKKIVELCKANNIKLIVFIPPSHATDMESIHVINEWQSMEKWKRAMTQLIPVWDFSGYNNITTEKIADKMSNYADNSHFTTSVGNLVLDRILSKDVAVPTDFGVLMTPANIDEHLNQTRSNREVWLKQNPDDAQLVRQIYQQVAQKEAK